MKAEILKILKKEKDYVSGQELCESLGVSRTAVWKAIRQLEEQGYVIEAVRNKGYRLVEEADVLTVAELHSVLDTKWLGKELEYYYETDSTNNRARDAAEKRCFPTAFLQWQTARQQERAAGEECGIPLMEQIFI